MNKISKLLLFALILSFAFSDLDCSTPAEGVSPCGTFSINEASQNDYRCISLDGTTCKWTLLCGKESKTEENKDTFSCSNYAISDDNIDTHTCIEEGNNCVEKKWCSKVLKSRRRRNLQENENTDITCSSYPVKDVTNECVSSDDGTYACKEQKYLCENVPTTSLAECTAFNTYTHTCGPLENPPDGNTKKCTPTEIKCNDAPKGTTVSCSSYPLSTTVAEGGEETTICIDNEGSDEKPCKEEILCEHVTSVEKDEDCLKYPVKSTSANMGCFKNSEASSACVEKSLCENADISADKDCYDFPVSKKI